MEQKRGRGRPPKDTSNEQTLTMLLFKKIESWSGLSADELEEQLLPKVVGEPTPGARWRRYARGDRTLDMIRLEDVHKKALEAGYLPKQGGFTTGELGWLGCHRTAEQIKTHITISNIKDRALVKQVAETRSMLRALKATLTSLGEGYWDSINELDEQNYWRQGEVLKKFDAFDKTLNSLRFDSLFFDPNLKNI